MNKQLRTYISVGVVLALLVGLTFLSYRFVSTGLQAARNKPVYVEFDNAQGLQTAEPVQMAGIKIGQVDAVNLTPENRARVTLGIQRDFHIPEGSRISIQAGLLGNSRHVEVSPNTGAPAEIASGATVQGISTAPLDETLAESKKLVVQGQKLLTTIQGIAGDPVRQKRLDEIVANTAAISGDLRRTTATLPSVKMQIDLLLADLRTTLQSGKRISAQVETLTQSGNRIAGNADKLTNNLNDTLNENRKSIKNVLASADEAATAVAGLTSQLQATLADPNLKTNINKVTGNLQTTTENVASITKRLDNVTAELEKLAQDKTLSSDVRATVTDLRGTVANLRETTENIKSLTGRAAGIRFPGERRRPADPNAPPSTQTPPPTYFSTTSLLEPGFVFDALYDTKVERLRTDANLTLLGGHNRFYRLGLFDATERNQLNLQFGQSNGYPATFAYRLGILSGKLGGGLDIRTGPVDLRFDMFDPNELQFNIRAKTYFNRSSSLFGGVDSVGKQNRATLGVQVRY